MIGKRFVVGLIAAVFVLVTPDWASAEDSFTDKLSDALDGSGLKLSFRYRMEYVDQDGITDNARANTLRTRLTFAPDVADDWGFLIELDDLRRIGSADFNDTRNGHTNRPVVADPKGTDLNQMALRYSGIDDLTVVAGRQRINRTNQRFVGGVGWRQNEQTYDGLTLAWKNDSPFSLHYAFIAQVNRIFGPDSGTPAEDLDSAIHLFDASYAISKQATLTAYAYLMDFDDADALSNSTMGLRLTGSTALGDGLALGYTAELAFQDDYGDNPTPYDADYLLLEAALKWSAYSVAVGYEVLEGGTASGQGFRTPLATLHKFQGWADKFLGPSTSGTPSMGIEDTYVTLSASAVGGKFALTWHDLDSETGSMSLGSELDLSASWAFAKHYGVLFKLARYDADQFATDTTKFWLMLSANF